jgi:hypothetical protein
VLAAPLFYPHSQISSRRKHLFYDDDHAHDDDDDDELGLLLKYNNPVSVSVFFFEAESVSHAVLALMMLLFFVFS